MRNYWKNISKSRFFSSSMDILCQMEFKLITGKIILFGTAQPKPNRLEPSLARAEPASGCPPLVWFRAGNRQWWGRCAPRTHSSLAASPIYQARSLLLGQTADTPSGRCSQWCRKPDDSSYQKVHWRILFH